ncbi:hypothetical protein JF50_18425 [Pseudoalteromonas luteoviolacea]|uniref:Cytochrome c family protein n=1 Tax=Pseudoalteromonas luteoviolacea TaxID=43657 RepID=A0A0C1Q9Z6_9GAMM|nr:hypothetical protein [Pseudoalteromonas luteoviolacea]KID56240.1 hypothetical protein JF50_18425 [Pseudoalteromonas luteoviolacea]
MKIIPFITVTLLGMCSTHLVAFNTSNSTAEASSDMLPTTACEERSLSEYALKPCYPATIENTPTDTSASRFAYQQFYAVNWPSQQGKVGIPDLDADYTTSSDHLPVWQTWPRLQDLHLSQLKNISLDWSSLNYFVPQQCQSLVEKDKNGDSALSKFVSSNPNIPVNSKVEVLFDITDAHGDVLFDKSNNPVFYQIYLNEQSWQFLSQPEPAKPYNFVMGNYDNTQRGAMFLKASWMLLDKSQVNDFHTSVALVVDPNSKACSLEVVGLAGLHIVNKSIPSQYKELNGQRINNWSWSTYEHTKNAPTKAQLVQSDTQNEWNLFNIDLTDKNTFSALEKSCKNNNEWDFSKANCEINSPSADNTTSQIVNTLVLPREIASQQQVYNSQAQKRLKKYNSNFINYELVASQWLKDKVMSPTNLSNTTMESFFQEENCSACHSDAADQDFMFLNDSKLKSLPDWIQLSGDAKLFN